MQRELRALSLQQPRHLVERGRRALRAGPDLRGLAVAADRGGGAQGLHQIGCSVSFARSVCSSRATWLSAAVAPCVPAQISADLPSLLTEAVALRGSIRSDAA